MAINPIGFMKDRVNESQSHLEATMKEAEDARKKRDGAILASVLPPDTEMPYTVTRGDSNESVYSWIRSVGVLSEGVWIAALPDGRMARWNPTVNESNVLTQIVQIDGAPDRLSMVIRQWVEEPQGDFPEKFNLGR